MRRQRCLYVLGVAALFLITAGKAWGTPEVWQRDSSAGAAVRVDHDLSYREVLDRFYAGQPNAFIWYEGNAVNEKGRQLLARLDDAGLEGLVPDDYMATRLGRVCREPIGAWLNQCELLLSESLLRYAHDVGHGRHDPEALDTQWHIRTSEFDPLHVLELFARADQPMRALEELPPSHAAYGALREALAAYRSLAQEGSWSRLGEGPTLRPGMRHPDVALLRRRLGTEFPSPVVRLDEEFFDPSLEQSVRQFQQTRGLDADGMVGAMTRKALSVPVADLIARIELNMERWRWLPADLGQRHILINIPAFELYVMDDGSEIARMKAITGRTDRSSPSFDSRLSRIVFNPDWTVPLKISVEDLLPKQQRDPAFLTGRGFRVLRYQGGDYVEVDPSSLDWSLYHKDHFPFVLRQDPGQKNSLGRIKFVMPNRFDIYLHDTPSKSLFNKSVRTLSSGCIRVQKPLQLARLLLDPAGQGDEEEIRRLLDEGQTREVEIAERVPVYLVYLTAWVEQDGSVQFRDDVYGRDRIMMPLFREFD